MYQSNSVTSPQSGRHRRLDEIVSKHIKHEYRKPIQTHNHRAFEELNTKLTRYKNEKLILDSCCGTGLSTRKLAIANPDALIVGIDQSAARLSKQCNFLSEQPKNLLLLRANCEDIWRLCVKENIVFTKHYILYPNPYPKPEHLKRRWHAHPVFPTLAKLSQNIELRPNWFIYLDEFKAAWLQLTRSNADLEEFKPTDPLSLFERKYADSAQKLYRLTASISQ